MITSLNRNKRMLAWIFSWSIGSSWLPTNLPMMLQYPVHSTRVRKMEKKTYMIETKLQLIIE